MLVSRIARIVFSVLTALSAPAFAGCYVDLPPPATVGAYEPLYYDGYVVYYDARGLPYYYAGGEAFWVPPGYAYYDTYVSHYRANWGPYHAWYRRGGFRYRSYRR